MILFSRTIKFPIIPQPPDIFSELHFNDDEKIFLQPFEIYFRQLSEMRECEKIVRSNYVVNFSKHRKIGPESKVKREQRSGCKNNSFGRDFASAKRKKEIPIENPRGALLSFFFFTFFICYYFFLYCFLFSLLFNCQQCE